MALFVGLPLPRPDNRVEVDGHKIYQYTLMLRVYPMWELLIAALYAVGPMFLFYPIMIIGPQLVLGAWIYVDLIQQCRVVAGRKVHPILLLPFSPATSYYLYQPVRTFSSGILFVMFS